MTKMSRALYQSETSGAVRKKQGRFKQTFILIISFKFLVGAGTAHSVQQLHCRLEIRDL